MSAYGILLCGGSGERMGVSGNKTLIPIGGVPACVRAARTLLSVLDGLVIVVRAGDEAAFSGAFAAWNVPVYARVTGGGTRQQSVRNGLSALPDDCDIVLVHDGARPNPDRDLVQRIVESVERYGTGVAAVPLTDTLKEADQDGVVKRTIPRDGLWLMQTPQGFRKDLLKKAHSNARDDMTDDAQLVEALGEKVRLVKSSARNLKLTTKEDIIMAQLLTGNGLRVGTGYDAHRLTEGRALVLCGVDIPFEKGLLGHSDADVALHALCDALLGAAAMGDIGLHFPDSDERYRGISSLVLTRRTVELLAQKGFAPVSADVTVVAQRPKLRPYIDQMRANVAQALFIPADSVSVKATTTEGMGFEGRGEGISAQAVATITCI